MGGVGVGGTEFRTERRQRGRFSEAEPTTCWLTHLEQEVAQFEVSVGDPPVVHVGHALCRGVCGKKIISINGIYEHAGGFEPLCCLRHQHADAVCVHKKLSSF